MDLRELTADTLKPYVGSNFNVNLSDGNTLPLVLDEVLVRVEKHTDRRLKRDTFSIFFRGPKDVYLQQGVYPLAHDEFGKLDLFLVPVGRRDDGGFDYEAVFT